MKKKLPVNYSAIILSAGYGTRLRPVTDEIPKPLISLTDRTLLENILLNLKEGGVAKFAVNTHHLGDVIEDAIQDSECNNEVTLFPEEEILGTGGPLVNAKEFLSSGDGFLLHNGDILTDIDLGDLLSSHIASSSETLVTMVMIKGPENRVTVDESGVVCDILGRLGRENDGELFTYAGIAVFSKRIFEYLPNKIENCSIITAILGLMKENPNSVKAFFPTENNFYWNDLGTVEKYLQAVQDIKTGRLMLPDLNTKMRISQFMKPLKEQGSSRLFYRIAKPSVKSKVIMFSMYDTRDFNRFINYAEYFHRKKLGVPEIFNINQDNYTVIMEDLGNQTLYHKVKEFGDDFEKIEKQYQTVVDYLIDFQSQTFDDVHSIHANFAKNNVPSFLDFDYDYLRWETNYFRDNFIEKYSTLRDSQLKDLDKEWKKSAEISLQAPQTLIHRDFQSQNIILGDEGQIRIVDFQGARFANFAYDLVSLVNDPYVMLPASVRSSLISYYYNKLTSSSLFPLIQEKYGVLSKEKFFEYVNVIALQRIMQALGAFTFLSEKKGKMQYLNYIPRGVELLRYELRKSNDKFPLLTDLIFNSTEV